MCDLGIPGNLEGCPNVHQIKTRQKAATLSNFVKKKKIVVVPLKGCLDGMI